MLFGGRRSLGQVPSLDAVTAISLEFLTTRLARAGRSRHTLRWRGLFSCLVLTTFFAALGFLLNSLVFVNAATAAVGVFIVAKFFQLKIRWQDVQTTASRNSFRARRQAIREAVDGLAQSFIPSMILFMMGGFALLVPFHCLIQADRMYREAGDTQYFLKPFVVLRFYLAIPGMLLGLFLFMLASLLWPATKWLNAVKAAIHPGVSFRYRPANLVAYALDLSLDYMDRSKNQTVWVGPEGGAAKPDAKACRNALIVALVAFGLTIAFLLLLLTAAAMR